MFFVGRGDCRERRRVERSTISRVAGHALLLVIIRDVSTALDMAGARARSHFSIRCPVRRISFVVYMMKSTFPSRI